MAAEQDSNTDYENTEVMESLISSGEQARPSFQDNNGHVPSSPEEDAFTPTSVIYFKEALSSASVQFGKRDLNPPSVVKYEFHIETTKKTKSQCLFYICFYYVCLCFFVCLFVCCVRVSNAS